MGGGRGAKQSIHITDRQWYYINTLNTFKVDNWGLERWLRAPKASSSYFAAPKSGGSQWPSAPAADDLIPSFRHAGAPTHTHTSGLFNCTIKIDFKMVGKGQPGLHIMATQYDPV